MIVPPGSGQPGHWCERVRQACSDRGRSDETEPVDSESGSDDAPAPETGTDDETETGAEDETDTDTDTDTDTGPDLASDLPPERECAEYRGISSFDHICFGEPQQLDPTPTNFVGSAVVDFQHHYYAAGPDSHRLLPNLFEPPILLPIAGTTVDAQRAYVELLGDASIYAIATKSPNALVILSSSEPVGVALELPDGTVDFLVLSNGRFLCASTSSGLNLLSPVNRGPRR